eukprot:Opistho-2@18995
MSAWMHWKTSLRLRMSPAFFSLDFAFESIPKGTAPDQPPTNVHRKPYWLMRVLLRTMVTGGYMTPKIYVPRQVWFQTGVKLSSVSAKFMCCDTVLLYLLKLEKENIREKGGWNQLERELDELCGVLDKLQNNLSHKLNFIAEVAVPQAERQSQSGVTKGILDFSHGVLKSVSRAKHNIIKEKVADDSKYIDTLIRLLEKGQVIEEWLVFFESQEPGSCENVVGHLRRISDFFYTVLCAFVMRDFGVLLKRYLRKTCQRLTEFE